MCPPVQARAKEPVQETVQVLVPPPVKTTAPETVKADVLALVTPHAVISAADCVKDAVVLVKEAVSPPAGEAVKGAAAAHVKQAAPTAAADVWWEQVPANPFSCPPILQAGRQSITIPFQVKLTGTMFKGIF